MEVDEVGGRWTFSRANEGYTSCGPVVEMSWHRAGVLLLGAQSCLPVPGVPAVDGIGSVLLSMARMGWKLCHVFRLYTVVMADHPPNHRGEGMDDFAAELARMTLVVGYPNASEYSTVRPLSGELPYRDRLEVHGFMGTCLASMVVEASGGTADHACQEAAYLMMAKLRDRHNYTFCNTAYRFHPHRANGDDVSTFRPTAGENDTTFSHMCAVMKGMDRMHSDLHKASKALNDRKLVRIIALKDEIARLKKENA
uniref:OSJNBa0014F04.2 protein n=1 Tax=Oryza sativa subsp. japonica TaxID=39947 RepID=Q7XR45_ORYSJ|nr:OSJNBa0014F04.2 [Oryza sativa Japonica Group]